MKHPNIKAQKTQDDFLLQCMEDERAYHARIFRIGNAAYRYHQHSNNVNEELQRIYYQEWLDGLPENIQKDMKLKGFENCKTMFPFTRYVNERTDIGMDEWMKQHLSEEDYIFYKKRDY
jgi:hypothetical protein